MENPFETIARRLSNIEDLLLDLKHKPSPAASLNADPYGDFNWLVATCSGIPRSTLRIYSAAGKIPGVVKFGKRRLYEKAAVLNWLRSQTRQTVDMAKIEQTADQQVNTQLHKQSYGGRKAA
ncbi:helix-turn-helix transcriptional regulator [Spirosoma areae]